MGVDYTFSTVIGVEIPKSWLYVTSTVTPAWCDHAKPEEAKHCPECGTRRPKPHKEQSLSPAFTALVGGDEYDAWNALHEEGISKLLPDGIEMSYHHDNCNNEVLLVGVSLASLDKESKPHTRVPLPRIPTEDEISAALAFLGVPYTPGSYGLHTTSMGY